MKRLATLTMAALTLATLSSYALPAYAATTTVNISGQVTLAPGLTLTVEGHAQGTASSLVGKGVDSTFHGNPLGFPPGTCNFPLTGSISGSVITLSGAVTHSTDPSFVGTPVTLIGDASTGAITFIFGPFTLTGTGNVVINNA